MESAILSSESPNSLFNSVAGSGNVQPASGSALPFASVLQSQQISTPTNASLALPTTDQSVVATQLLSGAQNLSALQQFSMDSSQQAASAPWLTLQAQVATQRDALSGDELQVLQDPTDLQWVDPALTATQSSVADTFQSPTGLNSSLTADVVANESLTTPVSGGLMADESDGFELSGGGGQANTFSAQNLSSGEQALSDASELSNQLNTGSKSLTQGGASDLASAGEAANRVDQNLIREGSQSDVSGSGEDGFDTLKTVDSTMDSSADSEAMDLMSQKEIQRQRELNSTQADKLAQSATDSSAESELESSFRAAASRESAEQMSEQSSERKFQDTTVSDSSLRQEVSQDRSMSAKSVSDTSSTTSSNAQSDQTDGIEIPETRITAADAEKQRAADAAAAQLAASTKGSSQSQGTAASVSASDAMATQVRSAMQTQAKRGDATERVDAKIATDGSEGYHWLESGADSPAPVDSELPPVNRPLEAGASAMTGTAVAQNNTTAVRADTASESFASVKQSVDVAQANEAKATELNEATNLEIETPVREAQWSQAFAYRVQFMAQQGIQRAQVQLNPAELGPMEVTVDIVDDVAQVQITAEHAATKEAVEQAVPRLREMMAQSGFGETNVEMSNSQEESTASTGDNPLMSNTGGTEDGEGGNTGDGSSAQPTQAKPIETLAANEQPVRSADGRLSFYV